ncbi:DUF2169 domain-containing protein [Desulfatiferula olefinivorans]
MTLTHNKTPYIADTFPVQDREGNPVALTVVKATFRFGADGEVALADEQVPICLADEYRGEVTASSLCYASDLALEKTGTDIVLNGKAYAPGGRPVTRLGVRLAVGRVSKTLSVRGDRFWQVGMGLISASRACPFITMPLVYERAFGGEDRFHNNEKKWGVCRKNPVGTGFRLSRKKKAIDGLTLPNIEDPRRPMKRWNDKPEPAGFGFVAPAWEPRAGRCGTFDAAWERHRRPLLPEDFDPRFYNAAPEDLIARPFLDGNEKVVLKNLHPEAELVRFSLPRLHLVTAYIFEHQTWKPQPVFDTLIIEPDENRLIMVFRSSYAGPEPLTRLKQVHVYENA